MGVYVCYTGMAGKDFIKSKKIVDFYGDRLPRKFVDKLVFFGFLKEDGEDLKLELSKPGWAVLFLALCSYASQGISGKNKKRIDAFVADFIRVASKNGYIEINIGFKKDEIDLMRENISIKLSRLAEKISG